MCPLADPITEAFHTYLSKSGELASVQSAKRDSLRLNRRPNVAVKLARTNASDERSDDLGQNMAKNGDLERKRIGSIRGEAKAVAQYYLCCTFRCTLGCQYRPNQPKS